MNVFTSFSPHVNHLKRYKKIMGRFHKLTSDLLIVSTHATPFEARDEWAGKPRAYTNYRFTDKKVWDDFCTRWGIPKSYSYSLLLAKTRTCK
jgi:hypothetical protein